MIWGLVLTLLETASCQRWLPVSLLGQVPAIEVWV